MQVIALQVKFGRKNIDKVIGIMRIVIQNTFLTSTCAQFYEWVFVGLQKVILIGSLPFYASGPYFLKGFL